MKVTLGTAALESILECHGFSANAQPVSAKGAASTQPGATPQDQGPALSGNAHPLSAKGAFHASLGQRPRITTRKPVKG